MSGTLRCRQQQPKGQSSAHTLPASLSRKSSISTCTQPASEPASNMFYYSSNVATFVSQFSHTNVVNPRLPRFSQSGPGSKHMACTAACHSRHLQPADLAEEAGCAQGDAVGLHLHHAALGHHVGEACGRASAAAQHRWREEGTGEGKGRSALGGGSWRRGQTEGAACMLKPPQGQHPPPPPNRPTRPTPPAVAMSWNTGPAKR